MTGHRHLNCPSLPEQKKWSSRSLGSRLQHNFFYVFLRVFGLKATKIPLFVVVAFFSLRPSIAVRAEHYISRRFKPSSLVRRKTRIFFLYWNFANILLERAARGVLPDGGGVTVQSSIQCRELLLELLAAGQGVILLSAHVGPWQVALAGLQGLPKVNIVQPRAATDVDKHFFEHKSKNGTAHADSFNIIDPQSPFGGFLEVREALRRNEIVCLMGDRLMPDEKLSFTIDFLGRPAVFPGSAYALASATGAPLLVVFAHRTKNESGQIKIVCEAPLLLRPQKRSRREDSLLPQAEGYVRALEEYVRINPYYFFNFHKIWLA